MAAEVARGQLLSFAAMLAFKKLEVIAKNKASKLDQEANGNI